MKHLTLKNYTAFMAVVCLVVALVYNIGNMPKTVQLAEDRWQCSDTQPRGIEAFCTHYVYKPTLNEKLSMRTP